MAVPCVGLCMLRQAYVGHTSADVYLINLDIRFNCMARHIVFQSMCQWEGTRTASPFPGRECPLRTLKRGNIAPVVCYNNGIAKVCLAHKYDSSCYIELLYSHIYYC